ncbi:MAG: GNAT family N-acetyltransferase [Acidimicrobiia bacterium]
MTPPVIRPVAAAEHEAVARMTVDVYEQALGEVLTDEYRVILASVDDRAASAVVLVAVDPSDQALLGSITYVPGPGPYAEFDAPDEAGLRMLVVAPEAQRRGVGTALVRACVDEARRAGKARVSLHTTPAMTGAQRLYEGLGFRRAPERDWVPEPGVQLLGYVLDLDEG